MTYARPFRWVANLPQSPTSLQPSTDLPLRRRLLFAWCAVPFWCAFQEDMRGLHLEMIRELEAQRYEMRSPRDAISAATWLLVLWPRGNPSSFYLPW